MVELNIYLACMNDKGGVVMVHNNCWRKFTDAWRKTTKNEVPKKGYDHHKNQLVFHGKKIVFCAVKK